VSFLVYQCEDTLLGKVLPSFQTPTSMIKGTRSVNANWCPFWEMNIYVVESGKDLDWAAATLLNLEL
jgi:hypothetical protein